MTTYNINTQEGDEGRGGVNTARVNKQNEMGEVKQNTMNTGRNTIKIIQETSRLRHTDLTQGMGEKQGRARLGNIETETEDENTERDMDIR